MNRYYFIRLRPEKIFLSLFSIFFFFSISSVVSRHVHSCFAVERIVSASFLLRNLTHVEVVSVCVSERGGGGWSRARGVSWAKAHDFFILLIILAQSDPLSTSTALLLIIHTASFHNPISNMTHHSLRLFYLAPECNVQFFLPIFFSLATLSASFNSERMRHDPLYVTSVVQSYIKRPGNYTGRKGTNVPIEPKSHMVKHSIPLWQAEKKKSHDHLSVFNEHRDWVFVCEGGRARKSTCTAWPVTFDSTSISKLHPSSQAASPPPPPHPVHSTIQSHHFKVLSLLFTILTYLLKSALVFTSLSSWGFSDLSGASVSWIMSNHPLCKCLIR